MQKVKIPKTFQKKFWPMVVYFEDLAEVIGALNESCAKVELSSDDYTFSSLEDAKEHFGAKPQTAFKISGSDPYSSIKFTRFDTTIEVSPGVKSAALFHELDEILTRCEPALPWLHSNWRVWLGSNALVAINYFYGDHLNVPLYHALTALYAISLAWFAYITYRNFRRHSLVKFVKRNETLSFMEQNRNAIAVAIITSLISGGIGYGFGRLRDGFASPASVSTPQMK